MNTPARPLHDFVVEVSQQTGERMIPRGVPMLHGGDESRCTQAGNNNAHSQDNETSWPGGRRLSQHKEGFCFTRKMMAFRPAHPVFEDT
jgi:isoamylase